MKLAIVGGRDFNDYKRLDAIVFELFKIRKGNIPEDSIISGGARGADALGKRYAKDRDLDYIEYPADWRKYGKSAGFKRNLQIVAACDIVLAFWDGVSGGTKDTIDKARQLKKPTFIVYY